MNPHAYWSWGSSQCHVCLLHPQSRGKNGSQGPHPTPTATAHPCTLLSSAPLGPPPSSADLVPHADLSDSNPSLLISPHQHPAPEIPASSSHIGFSLSSHICHPGGTVCQGETAHGPRPLDPQPYSASHLPSAFFQPPGTQSISLYLSPDLSQPGAPSFKLPDAQPSLSLLSTFRPSQPLSLQYLKYLLLKFPQNPPGDAPQDGGTDGQPQHSSP